MHNISIHRLLQIALTKLHSIKDPDHSLEILECLIGPKTAKRMAWKSTYILRQPLTMPWSIWNQKLLHSNPMTIKQEAALQATLSPQTCLQAMVPDYSIMKFQDSDVSAMVMQMNQRTITLLNMVMKNPLLILVILLLQRADRNSKRFMINLLNYVLSLLRKKILFSHMKCLNRYVKRLTSKEYGNTIENMSSRLNLRLDLKRVKLPKKMERNSLVFAHSNSNQSSPFIYIQNQDNFQKWSMTPDSKLLSV